MEIASLISLYRGALVIGFVNISVYFNKLVNHRYLGRFSKKTRKKRMPLIQAFGKYLK